MALSYVTYVGDGATTNFSVTFPYIEQDDVSVYVDGVLQTITTHYTWFSSTVIQFVTAPATDAVIKIARDTQNTSRLVDFQDAGNLTEADLDLSADQLFYLVQEGLDDTNDLSMQLAADNEWDAENYEIKNLADPTDAQDAVTKTWAETAMSSQLTQATTQATNAATSASNAATSETNAAASESAAATSASNASTSETNAATSASNAATSETNAASSASAASTSETNAATSETNAATSASNASTSETNAATSETNAAASYDSFDDRYLGAKASAPTLDNDGDPLLTGALYFNSTSNVMYTWTGSAWTVAGGLTDVVNDITPQLGGVLDCNTYNIAIDSGDGIEDQYGDMVASFNAGDAGLGVSWLEFSNESGTTGVNNVPLITTGHGSAASVDLQIQPKGDGMIHSQYSSLLPMVWFDELTSDYTVSGSSYVNTGLVIAPTNTLAPGRYQLEMFIVSQRGSISGSPSFGRQTYFRLDGSNITLTDEPEIYHTATVGGSQTSKFNDQRTISSGDWWQSYGSPTETQSDNPNASILHATMTLTIASGSNWCNLRARYDAAPFTTGTCQILKGSWLKLTRLS